MMIRLNVFQSWWKLISIEPVVFLYMLAIYIAIPTDEAFLYREICSKFFNHSHCHSMNEMKINQRNMIQKYASIVMIYFNIVYSIPLIFISMIYSTWSEKYSHKIPLILSNIGSILSTTVNLCLLKFQSNYSIEIFFISNLFLSLFGSTSTVLSIIYKYLLHRTTMENRTQRLAIIESCIMFGSMIGLISSGIILDLTNFQWNFFLILFIHFINILYIIFYVEEVIEMDEEEEEKSFSWKSFFLWNEIRILFQQPKSLLLALLGLLFSTLTSIGESSIVYLYLRKSPFDFSQSLYGLFRGLKSFSLGFGLLVILPILRYLFDINDMTCAILGTLSKCASDCLYAIDHSKLIIFLIPFFGMLSSYVVVGIRSYISKTCHHNEEGQIFSLIALLEALDALIGSIVFPLVYSYTITIYPSLIFILACFLQFFTLIIFIYIRLEDEQLNRRNIGIKSISKSDTFRYKFNRVDHGQ